ncbi:MAG: GTPase activating protein [Chrysothrix sp. TS-e1954]|nr:MAG: GTPase activating protein [Chrysothrix sp. TS-e1954]
MTQLTPPGTPPSPTASFYDLSDDEEGEYSTIRHTKLGRAVKLLYSKSKVYVHPSPSAKDNIAGFIALIQEKPRDRRPSSASTSKSVSASSLLLAWIPESSLGDAYETYVKVDLSDAGGPPRQSFLVPPPATTTSRSSSLGTYAFAVPVTELYSLTIRPPSIGWWFGSVIINTRAGDSFPALFFHDSECQSTILQRKQLLKERLDPFGDGGGMFWGGDEVLRWLKQSVEVEKSKPDPNVFLINPTEADREGLGMTGNGQPRGQEGNSSIANSKKPNASRGRDGGMDHFTQAVKEVRWGLLEKMSQVTTLARRTAQSVADHPKTPSQVKRFMNNPEVQTLQDEFDSARIYLARWAMSMAEQSERERSQRLWTARDVMETESSSVGEFELLDMEAGNLSLREKRKPVTQAEWDSWFDQSGVLNITKDEAKERIFLGGLDPEDGVRREAWLFLNGVYDWQSSKTERQDKINSLRDEYVKLKGAWWERTAEGETSQEDREWWKEQKNRIEKDVHRTDRHIPIFAGEDIPHPDPDSPFAETGTNVHLEQMKDMLLTYNEYNKSLGYVQGMSDLLAPIYAVMQDDALAFWAFVGFMERMSRNFLRDQSGMRFQLLALDNLVQLMDPALYEHLQKADSTNFFFFYRMMLVWYKREFEWHDVLSLWERLWTDLQSSNFHLFIAMAILEKHRDPIMNHLEHFDEVLKYINDLSGKIDLQSTLFRAEGLFKRFQRTVEAIDRRDHFPAPSVRQRRPQSASGRRASSGQSAVASSNDASVQSTSQSESRVVSPELRKLLSREVDVLDKEEVENRGGGVR